MTSDTQTNGIDDTLQAAQRLTATIAGRAAEIEEARRVPGELLDDLVAAGCFRMLVPPSHGGDGDDLAGAMSVFEALARADASVAWTVMIGSIAWCDLVGLPRTTFDQLFSAGPDVIMAGVFSPAGSIAADEDDYRVTGRWGFASGCEHASWIYGNCIEGMVDGHPQMRIAVFTPEQVTIEDTWSVVGLAGTGSHHFKVDDTAVPAERTLVPMVDPPCIDEVIARIPPPALLSLSVAAIAVGIARGTLDDVIAIATDKTPLLAESTLAQNSHFQFELANAETALRAARGLLFETAESLWSTVAEGSPLTWELRARIRAAAVWATNRATEITTTAYRAGGGGSIYTEFPLQRRLRDANAVTQHFLVRDDTMTTAGAIFIGLEPTVTVF